MVGRRHCLSSAGHLHVFGLPLPTALIGGSGFEERACSLAWLPRSGNSALPTGVEGREPNRRVAKGFACRCLCRPQRLVLQVATQDLHTRGESVGSHPTSRSRRSPWHPPEVGIGRPEIPPLFPHSEGTGAQRIGEVLFGRRGVAASIASRIKSETVRRVRLATRSSLRRCRSSR